MNQLLSKLHRDKIKINHRGLIEMDLFLSFLTVEVTRSKEHLGSYNGWTMYLGDNNLVIGGGVVNGVEYLDTIQYKIKLSDPYSNYVNPFFIKEIMTNKGINFFIDFYKDDIEKLLKKAQNDIVAAENHLDNVKSLLLDIGYTTFDF